MNVKSILQEWAKDAVIDNVMLDAEAIRIPNLHSKYVTILSEARTKLRERRLLRRRLERDLRLWYSGGADLELLERLGRAQFQGRVLKSDVGEHVELDDSIIEADARIEIDEERVAVLTDIVKMIHTRNFHIKNSIDWQKFHGGA